MKFSKIKISQKIAATIVAISFSLQGCQNISSTNTTQTQLQIREFQTRSYECKDQVRVLKAVLNVLQDEGYIIKSADSNLGYLTGSKELNIGNQSPISDILIKRNPIVIILKMYVDFYCLPFTIWGKMAGKSQSPTNIKSEMLEVTANISAFGKQTRVRVNFQRKAIDSSGSSQAMGQIQDASFYQTFFSKVDKGMFISSENL